VEGAVGGTATGAESTAIGADVVVGSAVGDGTLAVVAGSVGAATADGVATVWSMGADGWPGFAVGTSGGADTVV